MHLSSTNTSELRKNLGEALDWVVESKMPLRVQKRVAGGTRDLVIIPLEVLEQLLERVVFTIDCRTQDNVSLACCDRLGLECSAASSEEAVDEMLSLMQAYARDYAANLKLYLNAPNTSAHLVDVLKILNADEQQLRQALILRQAG